MGRVLNLSLPQHILNTIKTYVIADENGTRCFCPSDSCERELTEDTFLALDGATIYNQCECGCQSAWDYSTVIPTLKGKAHVRKTS